MKPGNSFGTVALFVFMMLVTSETMNAQDTLPRRDTSRPRSDTSMREPISAAPAPMTVIDLNTGQQVDIYYDTARYMTVNKTTRQPVEFYVINKVDTVEGKTGLIVNNMLVRPASGKVKLDEQKVMIMGDELRVMSPEGRRVYWTPQGMQTQDWGWHNEMKGEMGDVKQEGKVKQKGNEKKGKMKGEWGTIKWKKGEWKYEKEKGM